ncbi:MAG TPA: immunoglobulin domain-containing protein [Verrucomicrobiae bacterium]|nr:immunoglobulin domain-containing protein [Verrucomicrobiae bacterium]
MTTRKYLFLAVALSVGQQSSFAADVVWTNAAGGNWSAAANWNPNQVPTGADAAWITNSGSYTVTVSANASVDALTLGSSLSTGTRTLQVAGGTLSVTNGSCASNGLILISGGALQAAGTFSSRGSVHQTGGTLWLLSSAMLNTYNFTNGDLRGGLLTVTNLTWAGGNMYADATGDKTVIPSGGVFNLVSGATRYLTYNATTSNGRSIDNYGTWNWSGDAVLYGLQPACVINNFGTMNHVGTGDAYFAYYPGYGGPTWNNYGTFLKSGGTNSFYFYGVYANNQTTMSSQAGKLWFYGAAVTNKGSIAVQNGLLHAYGGWVTNSGSVSLASDAGFQVDNGALVTLGAVSSMTSPGADSIRLISGTLAVESTNVTTPSVLIAGGTLWHRTNNFIPTINQSSGTWRLSVPVAVQNYNFTNGELRGGTLTATNLNWAGGNMNADANGDRTIIPSGGVLNFMGNTTRYFSYNAPASNGRSLDNYGTWNWSGDAVLYGLQMGSAVNNFGTVNHTGAGDAYFAYYPGYGSPVWNNHGTFNKSGGSNVFFWYGVYLNNFGAIEAGTGALSLYGSAAINQGPLVANGGLLRIYGGSLTNESAIAISAASLLSVENSATVVLNASSALTAPAANSVRLVSGAVHIATTNLVTPSLWLNGATVYQRTNIAVSTINQSGGSLELRVPAVLANYNFTNGELRGRDLTVTNLNWYAGDMNNGSPSDGPLAQPDRTIIPAGGVANILGTADRGFSYYSSNRGRGLDNHGTINWAAAIQLRGNNNMAVNNYGNVIVTGDSPNVQFDWYGNGAGPVWNNFGTITRSNGSSTFYFDSAYLNNHGVIDARSGILSLHASIVTNHSGGAILLGAAVPLVNEQGSGTTLNPGSIVSGGPPNALRIPSGTVYLRSTDLQVPSLLISGGTLVQDASTVPAVVNQSAGVWRLDVPASATSFNLTNGELRGANLTVDHFNWLGGALNSDGPGKDTVTVNQTLNIAGNTAKSMSYWVAPGRSLINHGTGTWGGVGITGQGGATIRNNGSLAVTADVALVWGGTGPATVLHNIGTFTKSGGTGIATFGSTTITNSGTFDFNVGSLSLAGPFVQTAGSGFLGTNFSCGSQVRVESGVLTGRGTIAGSFYNNGVVNPGASPGLITAANYTNTIAAALNVELAGTSVPGTNYDQLRLSGTATLQGTLNVRLIEGFTPSLSNTFTVMTFGSRLGMFDSITPPPGVTFEATYTSTNLVLTVGALTNVPLQITSFPSNQTVWQPDPVTFVVGVSGTTPISFQWQFNSNNIPGATNAVFTIASTTPANSGVYNVIVTDATLATTNVSATLSVIPFDGTINWTNTLGGNWSVAANWLPNRVPGPTNTASISAAGTYSVTIDGNIAVSNLLVGSYTGTQTVHLAAGRTLSLGGDSRFAANTVLNLDGLLQTSGGSNYLGGLVNWYTGALSGAGRTVVGTNGHLYFIGSQQQKHIVTNIVENYGEFTTSRDAGIGPGQLPMFSGGAQLTNHISGVIHMGANGLNYAGSQLPRSFLVNHGTINTASSSVWSPSTIGIDFINYGRVQNYSYVYIFRGANYGEFWNYNALAEYSIFGDSTGEAFSFEPGTQLTGGHVNIACAGPVQWRAANTVHHGRLYIAQASGGAKYPNPEFRVLANYTNTSQVHILLGALSILDPAIITDLRSLSDGFVSFWSFGITNAGTMYVDNLSHTIYSIGNGGTMVIRTNAHISNSSILGSGTTILAPGATATFQAMAVDAQRIENSGTVAVTGGTSSLTGNSYFENKAAAQLYFNGGAIGGGPASIANFGTISGFGGISVSCTNFNSVVADDTLGRNLGLGLFVQLSGATEILRGQVGGALRILGGTLTGTNVVNGTVENAAAFAPGRPFGNLAITGNFTNRSDGIELLPIGGTNLYPTVNIGGTAHLAGKLVLSFTNGFYPIIGNTFTAMTYVARSGEFDEVVMPGYDFEVLYTPTALLLRASNALPSITFSVADGSQTQLVCRPFSLLASGNDPDGTVTNLSVRLNGSTFATVNGGSLQSSAEFDFPTSLEFVGTVIDNRGGSRSITQQVSVVTPPPHVLSLGGVRTNTFKICMQGEPGRDYSVLANTNLRSTNWVIIGPMERTNGIWRYVDTHFTNHQQRYYRARQIPQ